MHIPFTKDREQVETRQVIGLVDHSRESERTDFEDEVEDPSPSLEQAQQDGPPILERPAVASTEHAVQVASGLIDVLYENQRGAFMCGIPLFSSAGLWVTDPHAWTAIDHKYTPFTIFNATLPDPTWEWVWKRWFVDMSGDVDENGWTYNLNFTRHHWHGHYIWYHSFVRRRRWLRKRRKVPVVDRGARRLKNPAEDYNTIYSSLYRSQTVPRGGGIDSVLAGPGGSAEVDEEDEEDMRLENLGEFYHRLREARLDREKLDAVDNYLHHGRDLEALAGEMRHILRFMVFQESRRLLLTLLARRCQALEAEHGSEVIDEYGNSRHQCVKDSIDMADLLVNKLNYFSDRERVTRDEEDAEMERIIAARLEGMKQSRQPQPGQNAADALEEEERDVVDVHDLDQPGTSNSENKAVRASKPMTERKVSFMQDQIGD